MIKLGLCLAVALLVITNIYAQQDPISKLKSLPKGTPATLTIPPGVYKLDKNPLLLEGLKNVTIEAKGVTFLCSEPKLGALRFDRCENVTIKGLTIDYNPLPFTQGTVTAIDAGKRSIELSIHKGYPELTKEYIVTHGHLYNKDGFLKPNAADCYAKTTEALNPTTARLTFGKEPGRGFEDIEVGDKIVLNIRNDSIIAIKDGCKGFVLEDVTVHTGPGLGVLVRFALDCGTFKNFKIVPGPKPEGATEERLMSTCADGFNAAYSRKGPVIDGCEFTRMGDDGVNLHTVTFPVLKWMDKEKQTFLTMRKQKGELFHKVIFPGDEIRFLKEPNYRIVMENKVESIVQTEESLETWMPVAEKIWPTFAKSKTATFFIIKLQKPTSDVEVGDFCDVPATGASGFVIKNSYFHDHRARGLRLMSSDGLVENNRFERLKGAAISMGSEYAYWREAGWADRITIRNNSIKDVGEGSNLQREDSYTVGAISIMSRLLPEGAKTQYYPGNEDILIEKNTIDGCSVSGIAVAGAKGIKIKDNVIRNVNRSAKPTTGSEYGLKSDAPIVVIQAEVEQSGNKVE